MSEDIFLFLCVCIRKVSCFTQILQNTVSQATLGKLSSLFLNLPGYQPLIRLLWGSNELHVKHLKQYLVHSNQHSIIHHYHYYSQNPPQSTREKRGRSILHSKTLSSAGIMTFIPPWLLHVMVGRTLCMQGVGCRARAQ